MTKAASMFKSEGYITYIYHLYHPHPLSQKGKKVMDTYFEPATVGVTVLHANVHSITRIMWPLPSYMLTYIQ
jgi:hypothetical protein